MHTVFALLCFVVVIHWLIFPYPPGLLLWHCGNLTIAPVPAKQPWWIWINTSCEFIMNDCITTTKQSTTKPCAYFLGYTVTRIWTPMISKLWSIGHIRIWWRSIPLVPSHDTSGSPFTKTDWHYPSMDWHLHPLYGVQRLHHWRLGIDKWFHFKFYWACD